jgi:hypothetical protein
VAEKTARAEEAVAVAAAIARFEAEFSVSADEAAPGLGSWHRTALLEGVSAKQTIEDPGGGAKWLS